MVIQTRIYDGISVKTRTYRNITKGVNLAQLREGFFAQRAYSRFGVMVQLKGKERFTIGAFGVPDLDIFRLLHIHPITNTIHVRVQDQSTTYIGRFVETIDQTDGSYGDEDYEVETHTYLSLELEIAR